MTPRTLGAFLSCCACAAAGLAAQTEPVFRSDVALVRVDAEVSDSAGDIVTDLRKQDFRVFEDGKEQPIVNFSFEEEPLDVALLFDTGGGMHSKIHELLRAVELGFHELRKGDRASVSVFSGVSVQLLPLTADFGAVNDTILLTVLKQKFGGSSKMTEAADDAALRFTGEPSSRRRRAILAVSDKTAGHSARERQTIQDLWRADAVLSELILEKGTPAVDPIIDQTGGTAIPAGDNPGAAFQESLRRLRRRYTLYYAPPGTSGAERSIRVEVPDRAGLRVFARRGYVQISASAR